MSIKKAAIVSLIVTLFVAIVVVGAWLVDKAVTMDRLDSAIKHALIDIAKERYDNPWAYYEELKNTGYFAEAHKTLWVEKKDSLMYVYVYVQIHTYDPVSGKSVMLLANYPLILVFDIGVDRSYSYRSYEMSEYGPSEKFPKWLLLYDLFVDYKAAFWQDQIKAYVKQ